jgi:hypothetical protein
MAKYEDVYEDVEKMFVESFANSGLERFVKVKMLAVGPSQKDIIKPAKASDIVRYLNDIDVFMFVNETVFDQLEEVSQRILIEEAIARIQYDSDKDKLSINKGDIHTPSLLLRKHGLDAYEAVQHNISQVLEKIKEEKSGK